MTADQVINPTIVPVRVDDTDLVNAKLAEVFNAAKAKMATRADGGANGVLLAVADQSPLISTDGKTFDTPGVEYGARLRKTAELYRRYSSRGIDVQILITGGLHQHDGVWDDLTLREAGRRQLIALGVPESAIVSESRVAFLLRDCGLEEPRQAQDEMLLAARLFELDESIRHVYAIGGGNQLLRLQQAAVNSGILVIPVAPEVDRSDGTPLDAASRLHQPHREIAGLRAMAEALAAGRSADSTVVADGRLATAQATPVERAKAQQLALRAEIDRVDYQQLLPLIVDVLSTPPDEPSASLMRAARSRLIEQSADVSVLRIAAKLIGQLLPKSRAGERQTATGLSQKSERRVEAIVEAVAKRVALALDMAPVKAILVTETGTDLEQSDRRQQVIEGRAGHAVSLGLDSGSQDLVADFYATLIDATTSLQADYVVAYSTLA